MKTTLFRDLLCVCLAFSLTACAAAQAAPTSTVPAAAPSATPTPAPTLAPSATPTRKPASTWTVHSLPTPQPMQWQVPVLQLDWPPPAKLEYARWVDEKSFSFETYSYPRTITYLVSLDDRGNMALGQPPNENQPRSYSPRRRFEVECSASDLSLYRLPERHLVGSAALVVPDPVDYLSCNQSIQWAADDTALTFTIYFGTPAEGRSGQAIYFWKTGQPQPRRLVTDSTHFSSSMAPDFKHLLIIPIQEVQEKTPNAANELTVDMMEVASGSVTRLRLERVSWETYPGWLTNEVFTIRYGRYTTRYYDYKTGQYLFDFFNAMSAGGFHQQPTLSPDQRWVTLDHNFEIKRYSLYDVQTKSDILLYESPTWRLSFCGWKPDSSRLYLVNSPFKAFDPLDSPLPAGLLAYDPQARTADVLVPDAVRAFWSPDMRFAWVIRQSIDSQQVFASLYDAASGKLSGEYFVSLAPVKGDPAADGLGLDFDLRWSHDSTRALLVNARKELFLLSGSQASLLATGSYRPASWSPGDRYVLVYYARGAWVLDLSK